MTPDTVSFFFLSPTSLCSISIVLSPLLSLFSFVFLLHLASPLQQTLLFLSFLHLLYFLITVITCVPLFTVPRKVLWLINLPYGMPDLDFDIDVTTEWFIALCVRELCACVTCWHWITTAQLIEHFLKLDIWLLDFQIAGACSFFLLLFFAVRERCFSLLNNIFCCCAESPSCK